ncbi:hypothetical protein FNYG_13256 [Fusarium nygamai]|uniref:FAD-dependent oxidoreductase 2 FAD-binding domain-containing protein n=1 Tax=Gibberella nygamai TaxID=42673 RepID=A0A2K0VTJ9_GIBNY|nr:hypothetical protein FNYG_13256 [Fusarium nygamai]
MFRFLVHRVQPTISNGLFSLSDIKSQPLVSLFSSAAKTREADVVVVGAGLAGVCASIAAAEIGASVILVDAGQGGGASAISGGVVYAGGGTAQQKAAGYGHDTPENMFAYLKEEIQGAVNDETLRRFCNTSAQSLQWLEKHGARFEASLCPNKSSYPTDKHYLYFSGNEKSYPYNKIAQPAPRGHRMVHPGFSGYELWRLLFESAMSLGVDFVPSSKVTRLLFDEKQRINGVEAKTLSKSSASFARHKKLSNKEAQYQLMLPSLSKWYYNRALKLWNRDAQPQTLRAPSVILSAGGFAFNKDMRKTYMPEFSRVGPLGTWRDIGSGIALGESAGASVAKMGNMSAWRFIYPPAALVEGIVVSKSGRRMLSEDVYGATLCEVMIRQHASTGFLVLDQRQWSKARQQVFQQTAGPMLLQRLHWLYWGYKKSKSLEGLASKLGIAARELEETVKEYNAAIEEGREDSLHKENEYRTKLTRPPFYGIDISSQPDGVQVVLGLTLGGLCVDGRTGLVLAGENKIDGLYAAGRTAVGFCSGSYVSGLSLADCVFSGRRAGEHAAQVRRER